MEILISTLKFKFLVSKVILETWWVRMAALRCFSMLLEVGLFFLIFDFLLYCIHRFLLHGPLYRYLRTAIGACFCYGRRPDPDQNPPELEVLHTRIIFSPFLLFRDAADVQYIFADHSVRYSRSQLIWFPACATVTLIDVSATWRPVRYWEPNSSRSAGP